MTVLFDAGTRRLRLDQPAFDALVALQAGVDADPLHVKKLHAAGALDSTGQVRSDLGLASVVDPTAVAELSMVSDAGRLIAGKAWIAPAGATYLMTAPDGLLEVIRTDPSCFPISMARAVGLGPRPRPPVEPWKLPTELVSDLVSADVGRRQRVCDLIADDTANPATQEYVDRLAEGPWWYWILEVQWPAVVESSGMRAIHALDTSGGLLIMSEHGDAVAFDPISPTGVWQLLTMILPGDHEVAFGGATGSGA